MPRNKLTDIRDHLISAMEELMDEGTTISPERLERLKQTNEIGKTLVESAKAEASYVNGIAKLNRNLKDQHVEGNSFYQLRASEE